MAKRSQLAAAVLHKLITLHRVIASMLTTPLQTCHKAVVWLLQQVCAVTL